MKEKPDKTKGYAFVSNEWIFDERIKTELRLLIYISSLTAKDGYAYASNEHLAKEFKTTTVTISRQIAKLTDLGYIEAEYEKCGSIIQKRYLRLTKMLSAVNKNVNSRYQKCKPTVNKNVKDNNTSNNTTSINISFKEKKKLKNEDKLSHKQEFLDLWNKGREEILNKKSNTRNIHPEGNTTINNLIQQETTIAEVKQSIAGLLKQKGAFEHLKSNPNHLLKEGNFDMYLDAYINKDFALYEKKEKIDSLKGKL